MKNFNVKKYIDREIEYNPKNNQLRGTIGKETKKVRIKYDFTTRPHKFKDGEIGNVADKLIIEISFGKATIQPHMHFEEMMIEDVVDKIADEISGIMENQ